MICGGGVKVDALPMANTFGSASDFCPADFVSVPGDVITVTIETGDCHAGLWFYFLETFVESFTLCPSLSL